MRILAVCQRSWYRVGPSGGAETMAHDLVSHLVAQGWEASAVFLGKRPQSPVVVDGVKVYVRRSFEDFNDLVREADVIITHLGGTPMAKRAGKLYGKPVVQLVHNTNGFTVGFLGSGCDYAIYNADWVKQYHEDAISQKVIQVWESKHMAKFKVRETEAWPSMVVHPPVLDDTVNRNPNGEHITLVNLTPNKGPDVFYALAERNPDLKFMGVVGGYDENHQVIKQLPNVTIHPHTSNQAEFYSKTKVLLCPSIYESYGRVGIEAAQYGIPTVASPTPGLVESLCGSGEFADREDIEGWNDRLHTILDNYSVYSDFAHRRYLSLREQSAVELDRFAEEMMKVGHGHYRNL